MSAKQVIIVNDIEHFQEKKADRESTAVGNSGIHLEEPGNSRLHATQSLTL